MTKRLRPLASQRHRRYIGRRLREWMRCPMHECGGELRVVGPYREHWVTETRHDEELDVPEFVKVLAVTARLECQTCKLRLSVRVRDVAGARRWIAEQRSEQASLGAEPDDPTVAYWREQRTDAGRVFLMSAIKPDKDRAEGERERLTERGESIYE